MRLIQKALTFDDVLLVPAHSTILPRDVSLATRLTRNIHLNLPLVSAAMDTVTEARLAIALAQEGGIGIVHKNLKPQGPGGRSGQGQALRIRRAEGSDHHSADHDGARSAGPDAQLTRFPVCPWSRRARVVGIVTNRDLRFETRLDEPVGNIMTPRERLVTVKEGASVEEGQGADAQASPGARAGDQRRLRAARPDDGEGHPQVHRIPVRRQGRARPSARRRGHRHRARAPRSASELLAEAGVDVHRGRYRPRPFAGRAEARRSG